MRVVGGSLGGRRYAPPAKISARPTTDMAREGLFNILANLIDLEDITALDLFAGSGSVTYELLSREAAHVDCVEKEALAISFLRETSTAFRIADRITVHRADVFAFLKKTVSRYDFVFADPPYALPQLGALPSIIFQKGLLKEGGLFVLEHDDRNAFEQEPYFVRTARYGDSRFSFFKNSPSPSEP